MTSTPDLLTRIVRTIRLGNGRSVSLRAYIDAWRRVIHAPSSTTFHAALTHPFDHRDETNRDILLGQFRAGLDDRINRHIAWYGHGRKWSYQWQSEAINLAVHANTPRLVLRYIPPDFRDRFRHRFVLGDDD